MTENFEEKKQLTIDVTPVYIGDKEKIAFSFSFENDDELNVDDFEFLTPVTAFGAVERKASAAMKGEGYVELNISVKTLIKSPCARCLESVETPFLVNACYSVTPYLQNAEENETCLMTNDGILPIGEIARTLFLLNLPSKILCKEDCKGLCAQCGANLNLVSCSCSADDVDPRLSALKDYFKG